MSTEFYWIAVAAVIITSVARLTRLVTWDHFPPVEWARTKYANFMDKRESTRGWVLLAYCGYCASFWVTVVVMALGDLAGVFDGEPVVSWFTPAWWLLFGALGASYLGAILMANDGDEGDD